MGGLSKALAVSLASLLQVYVAGGVIAGNLLLISYLWGFVTHSKCFTDAGFISFFVVFASTMFAAVFGMIVRIFLWLPSLIHWWIAGGEPSFLGWLMPGLYFGCGR